MPSTAQMTGFPAFLNRIALNRLGRRKMPYSAYYKYKLSTCCIINCLVVRQRRTWKIPSLQHLLQHKETGNWPWPQLILSYLSRLPCWHENSSNLISLYFRLCRTTVQVFASKGMGFQFGNQSRAALLYRVNALSSCITIPVALRMSVWKSSP